MPPDLTLRLDAPTTRAHRSLEIASRFPQHPPRNDPFPHGQRQLNQALVTAYALLDTGDPLSGVAAFEVFLSGRFWTFGERFAEETPNISYFDATPYLCPDGVCTAFATNGEPRYYDEKHLSMPASMELGREIVSQEGVPAVFRMVAGWR